MIKKDFSPKGKTSTQLKDMNNILDCAKNSNLHLPISTLVKEMYNNLVNNECGNDDHSSLYKEIKRINKK
jgi:2-hydroxy-3-oxopropionate reductase